MSVWLRNGSSWSRPWKIGTSAACRGERTQAETWKPSDFRTSAGAFAIMPKPRKPTRLCSGRAIGTRRHSRLRLRRLIARHVAMQTQHVHDDVFRHHRIAARRLDLAERDLRQLRMLDE